MTAPKQAMFRLLWFLMMKALLAGSMVALVMLQGPIPASRAIWFIRLGLMASNRLNSPGLLRWEVKV
ncbi:hypothetical protein, partial [Aeromonas jandaei]|uniref:hypothetical protein n=1 Tax=Aeromonas jandaei TaxID=650 RepID=UPI003672F99C